MPTVVQSVSTIDETKAAEIAKWLRAFKFDILEVEIVEICRAIENFLIFFDSPKIEIFDNPKIEIFDNPKIEIFGSPKISKFSTLKFRFRFRLSKISISTL